MLHGAFYPSTRSLTIRNPFFLVDKTASTIHYLIEKNTPNVFSALICTASAADVLLKNADMFHPVNKQTRIGYKPLLKTKSKMIWQNWNVNISSFSFRGGIFSSNHYQMWYLVNKRPCPFACEWNESNEFEELTLEIQWMKTLKKTELTLNKFLTSYQ